MIENIITKLVSLFEKCTKKLKFESDLYKGSVEFPLGMVLAFANHISKDSQRLSN